MFQMPKVKICGLTRPADLKAAVTAGADTVGLVHYRPSPRSLHGFAAAQLLAALPEKIQAVLVVVDADRAYLEGLLSWLPIHAVQLCGRQRAQAWEAFPTPILRRLGVEAGAWQEAKAWGEIACGFVLDHPSSPGGSGKTVDRSLAAELAAAWPCLLAGGLDESGVAAAVAGVRPSGVDASSRLEWKPGWKDPDRVRAFVRAAKGALEKVHG
ncbi:MAG: phosphoribosylanthranilate isomerase [Planctomycetota bacterium]|nr:MAG: phosphoribosylanthranilate isomerase [Planctomycetota bacterium]